MEKWTARRFRTLADRYLRAALQAERRPIVNELAAIANMPAADFSKRFTASVGIRRSEYLKDRQIERAQRLLVETDLAMKEIAYRCGFGTRRSFFRTFKRIVGVSPARSRRAAALIAK